MGLSKNSSALLMPLLLVWKIKFGFCKFSPMCGEIGCFIMKTNKEASTVLCSAVKHLGGGRALISYYPLHFFRALSLPAC